MTVILGGGIGGLSAAYYLLKHTKPSSIKILEAADRLGGWIHSKRMPDRTIFELGPHTVRVAGAGWNTLNLVEEVGLTDSVVPLRGNHPAARTQLIYVNNKLSMVPNSLLKVIGPSDLLNEPIIFKVLKELFIAKGSKDDESVHSFFERRFGKDMADNMISAVVCGICAGDARQISVKSLFKDMFEVEQKHGSLVKGAIRSLITSKLSQNKSGHPASDLFQTAKKERWRAWTLQGGLETLPNKLADILHSNGVQIEKGRECRRIRFHPDRVECVVDGETLECDRLISSLPVRRMAELLREQHPKLADEFDAIPTVTVAVVHLTYATNVVPVESFGFLVPPKERLPVLGVLFDSCVFPQNGTVLTVMMGGAWFKEHFGESPGEEYLLDVAVRHVKKLLPTEEDPTGYNVSVLRDCIPQYTVGHAGRVARIRDYVAVNRMPLALCGASYQGAGVNDVILSAKQAVSDIFEGNVT